MTGPDLVIDGLGDHGARVDIEVGQLVLAYSYPVGDEPRRDLRVELGADTPASTEYLR